MRNFLLIGMMILSGCNNGTPPDSFGGGSSVSTSTTSNSGSGGMDNSSSGGNSQDNCEECPAHNICVNNTCVCIPKQTCNDLDCGSSVDDYCGGVINCEDCDPYQGESACGTPRFNYDGNLQSNSPNLCGGGCQAMTTEEANGLCPYISQPTTHSHMWWCFPWLQNENIMSRPAFAFSGECSGGGLFYQYGQQGFYTCCERGN